MLKGQQARATGVKEALDKGATYVVMGSQLTKGNSANGISAQQSRELTFEQIKRARYSYLCADDPIQMLYRCQGYYESRRGHDGKYLGPLVGYAHKDELGKNMVGFTYFNFAKADQNPIILSAYAYLLAEKLKRRVGEVDAVLGMPEGGKALAVELGRYLNCQVISVEKNILKLADHEHGRKEVSEPVIKRHEIRDGSRLVLVEDVCNNFSTTHKGKDLSAQFNSEVVAVATAVNRARDKEWQGRPVVSVCHIPSGQFRQNDPEVAEMVKAGNVIWKPKYEWDEIKKAMQ